MMHRRVLVLAILLTACVASDTVDGSTTVPLVSSTTIVETTTTTTSTIVQLTSSSSTSTTTTTTLPTATTTTAPTTTTTRPTTTTTAEGFRVSVRNVTVEELAHSWRLGCPVGPADLRNIRLTYRTFGGTIGQGDLVVHRSHVNDVIQVFHAIFAAGFPIETMTPISELLTDAEEQPDYANTSGFHCRFVAGTDRWSDHAYGRAIDINPHLNPLVQGDYVWPTGATRYVDRTLGEPGMIVEGDAVVKAFDAVGWGWGGRWNTLKDWHHFSATGR